LILIWVDFLMRKDIVDSLRMDGTDQSGDRFYYVGNNRNQNR